MTPATTIPHLMAQRTPTRVVDIGQARGGGSH